VRYFADEKSAKAFAAEKQIELLISTILQRPVQMSPA
jgi:hypothetical protein